MGMKIVLKVYNDLHIVFVRLVYYNLNIKHLISILHTHTRQRNEKLFVLVCVQLGIVAYCWKSFIV